MSFAQTERRDLATTMTEFGPDAPTLCDPWTVRDLAAHLVIRERRLDAAPGIFLAPFAGYTEKVQNSVAASEWSELVDDVRSGPPIWSPYKLIDSQANLGEMFVHHEDVRRAGSEWSPRELDAEMESALWKTAKLVGKLAFRSIPVGLAMETSDGRRQVMVTKKPGEVVLRGNPSELLLFAFGRDAVVLDFIGDEADIAAVKSSSRGI